MRRAVVQQGTTDIATIIQAIEPLVPIRIAQFLHRVPRSPEIDTHAEKYFPGVNLRAALGYRRRRRPRLLKSRRLADALNLREEVRCKT